MTDVADSGEPTDRMVAAVVPDGGQAWVYKVTGPIAAVDAHADEVIKFVASVPPAGGAALPTWKLPDGWTQEPGMNSFRLMTIRIPADDKPLELTLNQVPWDGTPAQVLQNVNRWRGQLKLPETTAAGLANDVREVQGASGTVTIVDLHGRAGGSGTMPPFAGGAGGGPFSGGAASGQLPAGHPPVDGGAAQAGAGVMSPHGGPVVAVDSGLKFDKPDSWQSLPPSQFLKLGFQVVDGSKTAKVSVSEFSASSAPLIADPLENINRWRSEVGLPPLGPDAVDKAVEPIEIDGHAARYVALIPEGSEADTSADARGTLGAMVKIGDAVWFFKISGNPALVAAKQDEFKAFLTSVKFAAGEKGLR